MSKALSTLLAASLLVSGAASAQTTPQTTPPTTAPATPANPLRLNVPGNAASALGIEVSGAVRGRLVGCPTALKVSPNALCFYTQGAAASLRPIIKGQLGTRAGDWKMAGKASSLAVTSGNTLALVLLAQLSASETLVVVDTPATSATRPAMPPGVVKGEPYLLGTDLRGLVNVTSLGNGQFKLERTGQSALIVTATKTAATLGAGSVELPLAPATDGKNLVFPFSGLGAIGCTTAPNGKVLTVTCGANSVGIKPIVF